jgi:segregation and condensation protein A
MTEEGQNQDGFEDPWPGQRSATSPTGAFIVDLAGFEGPLDLLLNLARQQKVDLTHISILQLADQYLTFIATARGIRLDLAADYLVMAAWLAYLKSRLLLPVEEEEEPSPELMAEALQFHLRRLEAMRECARTMLQRPQLGTEIFRCGNAEGLPVEVEPVWEAKLYELLRAYTDHELRKSGRKWTPAPVALHSMEDALLRLTKLVGNLPDWQDMFALLPDEIKDSLIYRSAVSSTFAASLELARQGRLELRQTGTFKPIEVRSRETGGDS